MTRIITFLIRAYRFAVSPLLLRSCRYSPSCSRYAIEAFRIHGVVRGCILTMWRILRCNPFLPGGYDPVPPKRHVCNAAAAQRGDRYE